MKAGKLDDASILFWDDGLVVLREPGRHWDNALWQSLWLLMLGRRLFGKLPSG